MDKQPIGVGVIGCGEIAQLMHLPYIHELPDLRIAGLCDLSPGTLAALGDHYGVATRTTDYRELLSRPDVDASLALDLLDRGLRKLDSDLIPLRWL